MALIDQEYVGANGLIYYGTTLLFCDSWNVSIQIDSIDITNISIYPTVGILPAQEDADGATGSQNLPFPENLPDTTKPFKKKSNNSLTRKYSQYMAPRLNIDGGLRVANITMTGLCAKYDVDTEENAIPRIGNYVYIQLSNSVEASQTLFNFPKVLIKNMVFEYNTQNYTRWNLTGITTGDFDIFPGANPV